MYFCLTFLKSVNTFLSAFLALLSILELRRYDVFVIITEIRYYLFAFFLIVLIDAFISNFVFGTWVQSKRDSVKSKEVNILAHLVAFQPVLHVIFVILFGVHYLAYFSGVADYRKDFKNRANIQNQIEIYINKNNVAPKSLEEIDNYLLSEYLKQLKKEEFLYEKTGKKNYTIRFGGLDKKLGTIDDELVSDDFLLQD